MGGIRYSGGNAISLPFFGSDSVDDRLRQTANSSFQFSSLGNSTDMHSLPDWKNIFGIQEFRGPQEEIISRTLKGKHSLVIMPTGMGKSVCYQLPGVLLEGLTIVISPLIALMQDQVDKLKAIGVDAEYINSSLSGEERESRYGNLQRGMYKILYVSPERFRKPSFLKIFEKRKVSLLAVDEAHCVSQWGHDFRPDYSLIHKFRGILGNPTTIALTATATREVQADILQQLGLQAEDVGIFNEGISRPNLYLEVRTFVDSVGKKKEILSLLKSEKKSTVVYFNLIKNLESFAEQLDLERIPYRIYHGQLAPERRRKVQNEFLGSSNMLLLATNSFGMGVDKRDIRRIIHAELPASLEAYYQEIGRAGRDGKPSECHLFYNEDDLAVLMDFLEWQNPDKAFIEKAFQMMDRLGESLSSFAYEDLQAKLTYKNRGDHRLQTVLNLFDRYGVTRGEWERGNLKLVSGLPLELLDSAGREYKKKVALHRLYQMLLYLKSDRCRREFVYEYFSAKLSECGNCDICKGR